jgi:type IX secretion system PorP/SprF family membrane protein
MIKRKILVNILFLFCSLSFLGQDFHFSQFSAVPFWLNPALVGGTSDVNAGIIYRTQDKGIDNPYTTYGAFADVSVLKKREKNSFFGVGVGFIQDNNKSLQYTSSLAALALSYHLRITRKNLISFGLQPFFFQKNINYTSLKWGNQYDGTSYNSSLPTGEPGVYSKLSTVDGSLGVNYQYVSGTSNSIVGREKKFQIGLSMFHLPWTTYSFYSNSQEKVYSRYSLNMSFTFKPQNSRFGFSPILLLQKQGPANDIIFGCNTFYILQESSSKTGYVKSSSISAGLLYRVGDAFIVNAGINYENFYFSLSYDINASALTTSTGSFGAFEICLRYRMNRGHWSNSN